MNDVKMILGCNALLINSVRQQGYGNILVMLYLGAKVFLRTDNPLYSFIKSKGGIIFDIEDIASNSLKFDTKLDHDQRQANRMLVKKLFERKHALNRTSKLLEAATKARELDAAER